MVEEISAGGVVINDDKVLVVFQAKTQTWALPKGHVDKGESPIETAIREIYEESGIKDLTYVKELGSYFRGTKKNPDIRKKITYFHFTTKETKLSPQDPDNPEAKWVSIDGVVDLLSYEADKEFFKKIKYLL